jgi:hypothetical protein
MHSPGSSTTEKWNVGPRIAADLACAALLSSLFQFAFAITEAWLLAITGLAACNHWLNSTSRRLGYLRPSASVARPARNKVHLGTLAKLPMMHIALTPRPATVVPIFLGIERLRWGASWAPYPGQRSLSSVGAVVTAAIAKAIVPMHQPAAGAGNCRAGKRGRKGHDGELAAGFQEFATIIFFSSGTPLFFEH